MKFTIFGLMLFLAACNGSGTTEVVQKVPYSDPALVAKIAALTQALAAATHESAQKFSELSIVGKSASSSSKMQGEFRQEAVSNGINFGPCTGMGVLVGFINADGVPANALSALGQVFHQCTGYMYSTYISDGTLVPAPRVYWDGPCVNGVPTGNPIEWEAAGNGYNTSSLQNGVVFASPVDKTPLMVEAGQTPQPILIQSVWVSSSPGCQSDVEIQNMYTVVPNDYTISGVPSAGVGKFQLGSP